MVADNGAIVAAANGAGCTDTAVVGNALIQFVGQHEALHAEQEQQQCNTQYIGPMAVVHSCHSTYIMTG